MTDATKKILVIEDDPILSETLLLNLEHDGFATIHAKDGEEGLALALSAKPDLILLDIILPKVDGLTMLDTLRQDPWGKHVPVIVLSNLSELPEVIAAVEGGVRDYLVKVDWQIEDVIQKIREKLKLA